MPDTSGSDYSADDSDEYKPDAADDNDSPDDVSMAEDDDDASASDSSPPPSNQRKRPVAAAARPPPPPPKTPTSVRPQRSAAVGRRRQQHQQQDFVPESEVYFTHHVAKKSVTSDRTLDRMKTPRLPHDDLFRLLATTSLSARHERAVADMNREHCAHFARWMFCLDEGYSILLHGLGSKRNLMQQFHQEWLAERTVLVVNGFFPSLTIKDVLDSIAVDILEMTTVSRNLHEVVDAIADELAAPGGQHVFLLVHNIDGVMLRNHKAQLILSRLAKIEKVHLIASMDHINAPLREFKLCGYSKVTFVNNNVPIAQCGTTSS